MSKTITKTKENEQLVLHLEKDVDQRSTNELELSQEILDERDREISDIRDQAVQINEMMQDLSSMISSQASGVRQISENTGKTRDHTENALKQLKKADNKQDTWFCSIS